MTEYDLNTAANFVEALRNQREDIAAWLKKEGDRRATIGTFRLTYLEDQKWYEQRGALDAIDTALQIAERMYDQIECMSTPDVTPGY